MRIQREREIRDMFYDIGEHDALTDRLYKQGALDLLDEIAKLRVALTEIHHGATHQGAHIGMSFQQVAEIARNALKQDA